jgi:hypothetical protein
MQVDATEEAVLTGIESHRGLLLSGWLPPPSIRAPYAEEEASMSINTLQLTALRAAAERER